MARGRGFNSTEFLPVFDKFEHDDDKLIRIDVDGNKLVIFEGSWVEHGIGKWTPILDKSGKDIPLVEADMESAKEFAALINRVGSRDDRTHPYMKEMVAKAFAEWDEKEKDDVKAAFLIRNAYYDRKKIREKEIKKEKGLKDAKHMTMTDWYSDRLPDDLFAKDKFETKEEKEAEKLISDAIDIIQNLTTEKMSELTNSQVLEIKTFEDKMMDAFMAREDESEDSVFSMGKSEGKYYPLSRSSRIMKIPKNADPSYLTAGIRIMEDILENHEELVADIEKKNNDRKDSDIRDERNQVKMAEQWLAKHGPEKYSKLKKVEKDYEAMFQSYLKDLPKEDFKYVDGRLNVNGAPGPGEANFYRIDKSEDDYSEHMVIGYWNIEGMDFPKVMGDQVELLEGTPLYDPLCKIMSTAIQVNRVLKFRLSIDNTMDNPSVKLTITFEGNEWEDGKSVNFSSMVDRRFREAGFMLGENSMALELDKVILVTSRAKTLGLHHPNNKNKKEYFSNAQYFEVYDTDWKELGSFNIDERGYNTFSGSCKDKELTKWLTEGHKTMKANHSEFGDYDSDNRDETSEGSSSLYAHDFMLWLKDHQMQEA